MLVQLRIQNLAVIDDLTVDFHRGLNTLTGETGAGKSIIVGAVSLLLGDRASSDFVRTGSKAAKIEGVFDVSGVNRLSATLEEQGIDPEEGLLILRREISREGRSRGWINGSPVPIGVLGTVGRGLVDIHGQHEHQALLSLEEQRRILDAFAGAEGQATLVAKGYRERRGLLDRIDERKERHRELSAREDFLRFQLREIDEAAVTPNEDEALDQESRKLQAAQELSSGGESLADELYEGDQSVANRIAELKRLLGDLARIDSELAAGLELLDEAYHAVSEAGRNVGSYARELEHDPLRLSEVEGRRDLLFRLKGKYGPEISDILETRQRLSVELEELDAGVENLEELERRVAELEETLQASSETLSRMRAKAAGELEKEVGLLLPELGMPDGVVRIQLTSTAEIGPGGRETVEFLSALNTGLELRSLRKVASGGELSRLMLCFKAVLTSVDSKPTLVFDEIDAGIGGEVASAVARMLGEVSRNHQVFVITHLAQIASRADHHLAVEKRGGGDIVATEVRELKDGERVREIARMLGGDPDSPTSREHARELLADS